jgi:hypothetical protein
MLKDYFQSFSPVGLVVSPEKIMNLEKKFFFKMSEIGKKSIKNRKV